MSDQDAIIGKLEQLAAENQELRDKLKCLEGQVEHLKTTMVCPKCEGDGKQRWLSIGGGLNVASCWKCDGGGRVPVER